MPSASDHVLRAIRRVTGAAHAVLDTPARLRSAIGAIDAAAVQLLDPPAVVPERVQTVADWQQARLTAHDAWCERQAQLLARLTEIHAENAARLDELDAQMLERGIAFN